VYAFASESEMHCLDEQTALLFIGFFPESMPNAIQVQLGPLLRADGDGWIFARDPI
jgi:hypothetical protein